MKVSSLTDSRDNPKVSVVIPVYNGRDTIGGTVEHLLAQSLAPHEIIIVDDGSTDGTSEVLESLGDRVKVLRKPNGGPASARNHGIRAATGEFIAFTDGDCLPDKEWLSNIMKGFDGPQVGGVGGVVRRADEGLIPEYTDLIRLYDPARDAAGRITYLTTGNSCFRRAAVMDAGLFDERFRKPGGEEPDLCRKVISLGYELNAVEDAIVLHHHMSSVRSLLKAFTNYGEGHYILGSIWPELKWKGDPRKGLIASFLSLRFMFKKYHVYRPAYGLQRALLFSFLDEFRKVAFGWGYLRGQKTARKN
jgi:glycosyltransferase involved in cell wall biosynthesis